MYHPVLNPFCGNSRNTELAVNKIDHLVEQTSVKSINSVSTYIFDIMQDTCCGWTRLFECWNLTSCQVRRSVIYVGGGGGGGGGGGAWKARCLWRERITEAVRSRGQNYGVQFWTQKLFYQSFIRKLGLPVPVLEKKFNLYLRPFVQHMCQQVPAGPTIYWIKMPDQMGPFDQELF